MKIGFDGWIPLTTHRKATKAAPAERMNTNARIHIISFLCAWSLVPLPTLPVLLCASPVRVRDCCRCWGFFIACPTSPLSLGVPASTPMMNDYSFASIITATLGRAERFAGRACQQPGLMKKRENLENKRTHKKNKKIRLKTDATITPTSMVHLNDTNQRKKTHTQE